MQLWKSPTWSTDKPPDVRHEDMSRMQLHRMLVIVTTCRNLFQHAQLTASQLGRQRKMKVLAEQQRTGFNCFITKPQLFAIDLCHPSLFVPHATSDEVAGKVPVVKST